MSMLTYACEQPANTTDSIRIFSQFSELEPLLKPSADKTLVINFWATTCKPCIQEMPHFNELHTQSDDDVQILLVSVDKAEDLPRVEQFVARFSIKPEVVVLDDPDYSSWTAMIDPEWYGALPATLIVSGDSRKFHFGAYESYAELLADLK